MATDSDPLSVHNTLAGATADTISLGVAGTRLIGLEVVNPSATAVILYFTYNLSAVAPTTAVAAANGTIDVLPGGATGVPFNDVYVNGEPEGVEFVTVSVVGNGNAYSVRGIRT